DLDDRGAAGEAEIGAGPNARGGRRHGLARQDADLHVPARVNGRAADVRPSRAEIDVGVHDGAEALVAGRQRPAGAGNVDGIVGPDDHRLAPVGGAVDEGVTDVGVGDVVEIIDLRIEADADRFAAPVGDADAEGGGDGADGFVRRGDERQAVEELDTVGAVG